jgi:hypothetical protein
MTDTNVFVVSTPLQLIGSAEARRLYPEGKSLLVIARADNARTRDQIGYLLQRLGWSDTEIVHLDKLFFYITVVYLVRRLISTRVGNLYIGNMGSWIHELFYTSVPARRVVFLDDGAATIAYYSQAGIMKSRISSGTRAYFRLTGLPLKIPAQEPLNFFTFFPLQDKPGVNVIRHDFPYFKLVFPRKSGAEDVKGAVGFLGQQYNSAEEYARLVVQLKHVAHRHPGSRLVYFMHRKEDRKKLGAVLAGLPVEIRDPGWPVEVEVATSGVDFIAFYSFISTALFTLKSMFPELKIYQIDDRRIAATIRHYNDVVEVFRAAGIETVSL